MQIDHVLTFYDLQMLGGGFLRNVLFLNHFVCFVFLDKALQRLFQGMPCVFQRDNEKSHTASITTAWLRSRRVQELNWPACSPDLSNIENIWRIIKQKNMSKTTSNSSAAGSLYKARMGPNSNTKNPETHNLDAQTSSSCFEKKRRCYTMVNMPSSQLFWDL